MYLLGRLAFKTGHATMMFLLLPIPATTYTANNHQSNGVCSRLQNGANN
jgi:hypothetical protein